MSGQIWGVGLGPGDPGLVTRKAWALVEAASTVAYPAPLGGDSFARSIVAEILGHQREIRIDIPMTVARFPAQDVYDKAAADISHAANGGEDVVVLCEGDPFFYGSFMYLYARLAPHHEVTVVPGVTSVTTCAAVAGRPLSARGEALSVIPGTLAPEPMAARVAAADAMAFIKVGRHLPKIREVLEAAGLLANAVYVARASLPNEVILPLAEAPQSAPYFSMILANRGGDPWLS